MRLVIFLFMIWLGTVITEPVYAREISEHSAVYQAESYEPYEGDDGFAPALFVVFLIVSAITLLVIGAGIVLAGLAILAILLLIALGVLSASVAVGVWRKSFESGFRTFLITGSVVAGGLCGLLIAWFGNFILTWWPLEEALIAGGVGGVAGGLIFGVFAVWLARITSAFISRRYAAYKNRGLDQQ